MTSGETLFLDANILVYAALRDDVRHSACRNLLRNPDGPLLHFSLQILAESYSVITSPKRATAAIAPRVFDLQIASTMAAHGVRKLATYNGADFKEVAGIEVVEPESISATQ